MRISLLREFKALASNRSYAKTAKELFMAPSTLSNHMTQLQEELGFRLIDSKSPSFTLTSEGLEFLSAVWRILDEYDSAVAKGLSNSSHVTPLFVQATKGFRFEEFLKKALVCSETDGKLRIEAVDADEGLPEELLPNHSVDLAMLDIVEDSAPFINPILEMYPDFKFIPLASEKVLFAVEPDNRLAEKPNLHFSDLDGSKILIALGNKSSLGFKSIAAFLHKHNAEISPTFYQPSQQNKARHIESVAQMKYGQNVLVFFESMTEIIKSNGKVILDFGTEDMNLTHFAVYDSSKLDTNKLAFVKALEELSAKQKRYTD